MKRHIRIAVFAASTCAAASGQTILTEFLAPSGVTGFYVCNGAGDVNGDGFQDIVVGGPGYFTNEIAKVYSGANYSVLYSLAASGTGTSFGSDVAGLGDVNGDGKSEFLIGASNEGLTATAQGVVRLYSGANGAVLQVFAGDAQADRFGAALAAVDDVNGDGIRDWIVGAHGSDFLANNGGAAHVYSGASGALLYKFFGAGPNDTLGLSVAGAGDVNNDGREDLIVGAPQLTAVNPAGGYARVYSGMNGSVLYTLFADSYHDGFGSEVAGIGDVNADGYDDFAVAAPDDDNNGTSSGSLRVFSGATGLALYTINGSSAGVALGHVQGRIDLDTDGKPDLLVGVTGEASGAGRVFALRGYDGSPLFTWSMPSSTGFGVRIRLAGDTNNDGFMDVLVGAFSGNGESILISGFDCPIVNYCIAAPNSVGQGALMSSSGSRSVMQNNFTLIASGVQPAAPGLFFYGATAGFTPFGNGYRCLAGAIYRLPVAFAQNGVISYTMNFGLPPNPLATIVGGSRWRFQGWDRDVAGPAFFNRSAGLDVTFCP